MNRPLLLTIGCLVAAMLVKRAESATIGPKVPFSEPAISEFDHDDGDYESIEYELTPEGLEDMHFELDMPAWNEGLDLGLEYSDEEEDQQKVIQMDDQPFDHNQDDEF